MRARTPPSPRKEEAHIDLCGGPSLVWQPQPLITGVQAAGLEQQATRPACTGSAGGRQGRPQRLEAGRAMQGSPSRPPLTGSSSMEIRLAEGQGRYQSPGGGTATAGPSGGPGGSPTSDGVRTEDSDAAEYSENARLVGAALSDDGMTPLIQVRGCVCAWGRCQAVPPACGGCASGLREAQHAGSGLGMQPCSRLQGGQCSRASSNCFATLPSSPPRCVPAAGAHPPREAAAVLQARVELFAEPLEQGSDPGCHHHSHSAGVNQGKLVARMLHFTAPHGNALAPGWLLLCDGNWLVLKIMR